MLAAAAAAEGREEIRHRTSTQPTATNTNTPSSMTPGQQNRPRCGAFRLRGTGTIALLALALLLTSAARSTAAPASASASPELYFLLMNKHLNVSYDVAAVSTLFARAEAANYTGVILYDFNLDALGSPRLRSDYLPSLRQVVQLAGAHNLELVPLVYSFGHSAGVVFDDVALAEPVPAAAAPWVVSPEGTDMVFADATAPSPLPNGDFELHDGNRLLEWTFQEAVGVRTFVDNATSYPPGGRSLRVDARGAGRARAASAIFNLSAPLVPIHARCYVRTEGITDAGRGSGTAGVHMSINAAGSSAGGDGDGDDDGFGSNCVVMQTETSITTATQPWRPHDVVCWPSGTPDATHFNLWLGMWGNGTNGSAWFDACSVHADPLLNVLRRPGAPLRVVDMDNPEKVYEEGRDFSPIAGVQEVSASGHLPFSSTGTSRVALPAGTRLRPGQRLALSYYGVPGGQAGACLASNASLDYVQRAAEARRALFGPGRQYFVNYDEMRSMHSCEACRAKRPTPGELLAWHVNRTVNVLREVAEPSRMMVWQDMFDPFANGNTSGRFYHIQGGVSGAWKGLPRGDDLVIANWDHRNGPTWNSPTCHKACETQSLHWFEKLGFQQLICGYYGSGNGTQSAMQELSGAAGVTGLLGMIYGSWAKAVPGDPSLGGGDYSQLEEYAAAARKFWPGN